MNVNSALKQKNKLAKDISNKQVLLATQNVYKTKNAETQQYNTKNILGDIERMIDKLVETKAGIARANQEVYPKIFRMAELKGLAAALKMIPVKLGKESETVGYRGEIQEVEWASTLTNIEIDKKVAELEAQIQSLQDDLDKFNFTTEVQI